MHSKVNILGVQISNITNEHLLVGILEGKDIAANVLKDSGIKRGDLLKAIALQKIRRRQKKMAAPQIPPVDGRP